MSRKHGHGSRAGDGPAGWDPLPRTAAAARPAAPVHGLGGRLGRGRRPLERDLGAAEQAAGGFLTALGLRIEGEATADTPRRIARAYAELLSPHEFDLTTFANDEAYDRLVVLQAVPFASICEHHPLPFVGTDDVGYLPAGRIIVLSKLARVVEVFAHRHQVQEWMYHKV